MRHAADRQADRGIRVINNASSTNYLEILNYRGRGLETVQEGQGYTLSAHFMPYDLPSDDNPKDQQFAVLVKQGHHIGLSYGADKRFAMSHQFIEGSKTNLVAAISSGKFDVNEWHHVVGTVDRSEGLVKIYVNGKEAGSASFTKNSRGVESANVWRVGAAAPRGQSVRRVRNTDDNNTTSQGARYTAIYSIDTRDRSLKPTAASGARCTHCLCLQLM